ncbi:Uncharacterised protein [Mycobacteroides abscessus subsp. abscessus]|nr:Uncharacterised protein [Mycobacteroides abscessus subsp. abscessus]
MKTEWNQEPHLTVRWALFEAIRAADNASVVDYWDVVTENLIRELKLRQEWGVTPDEEHVQYVTRHAAERRVSQSHHLVDRLVSDWKRVDSDG